jgi:hypothetical protein
MPMSADRPQSHADVKFLLISIGLHLLFLLLAPGLGYGPPALPLARGGATLITLVPDNGDQRDRQPAVVAQPVPKSQAQPSKATPVPSPKPAEKKEEAPPRPATQATRVTTEAPAVAVKIDAPARVLTSDRGDEAALETVGSKPAVTPAGPTPPTTEPEPATAAGGQKPAGPPLAGDVVGGFGAFRMWQAKEFALLLRPVRLQVVVTVSADARNVVTRAIGSTGSKRADDWALRMVPAQLKFQAAAEPYELTIEVLFDPDSKRVAFSTPDERVRFVRR